MKWLTEYSKPPAMIVSLPKLRKKFVVQFGVNARQAPGCLSARAI
jgi:hypothetical protein